MDTALKLQHQNREWYEELCALAAIGEASSSQFDELQRHLADCPDCRQLYADFRRISAQDLGLVAVKRHADPVPAAGHESLDEDELFARLRDRATREPAFVSPAHADSFAPSGVSGGWSLAGLLRRINWLRRPELEYLTLAVLFCAAVGVGSYRWTQAQLSPLVADLRLRVAEWQVRAQASAADRRSSSERLRQNQEKQAVLRQALRQEQSVSDQLRSRQQELQAQLAAARTQLEQATHMLQAERTGAEDKSRQIADLEARLQGSLLRSEEQRKIVDNLRNRLELAEQDARSMPLVSHVPGGPEIRELFGARDLHIVDVYDVDSSGKTERTYGRVYYVEKKLLIFYAFDLGDKRPNDVPAGFQAWGYRQPNQSKPQNLGMFTVDDASKDRWVLEVSNPRVLEHIDAVFVTLESPKGSPSPRGRRLLYANLAAPPNHP
jgi:hypothetical protein